MAIIYEQQNEIYEYVMFRVYNGFACNINAYEYTELALNLAPLKIAVYNAC